MKKIVGALSGTGALLLMQSAVFAAGENFSLSPDSNLVKITSFTKVIGFIVAIIMVLAVIVALIYLLWGGLQWITSGGDKAGVEAAQKKIQAALIGLVVVFSVWALMMLVARVLGIDLNNLQLPDPTGN